MMEHLNRSVSKLFV